MKFMLFISYLFLFFVFLFFWWSVLISRAQYSVDSASKQIFQLSPSTFRVLPLSFSHIGIESYHRACKFIIYTQGMLIIGPEIS